VTTTYVLRAANSDLSGGADFSKRLQIGTETAGSITVSVAGNATEDSFGFADAGQPDDDGITGDYTVEVNVLGLGLATINLSAAVARVNSAGVQQAISAFAAEQAGLVGIKTFAFTGINLGTWAIGDRLKVVYRFRNTLALTGSLDIQTGTTDAQVVTPWTIPPRFSSGSAADSGRDWNAPHQDITVTFTEAAQDAALSVGGVATGHIIKIGGVAQTTTYRSGSGTASWVFRVPMLVKNGQSISYSYDRNAGNSTSVSTGVEVDTITNAIVTNSLTKRLRFTLNNAAGAAVATTAVKCAALSYQGGNVANASWMSRETKVVATSDAAGFIDMEYTGAAAVDALVYLVTFHPDSAPIESHAVSVTVT
jgi:hypothetical protein